jgi:hypothetical protein
MKASTPPRMIPCTTSATMVLRNMMANILSRVSVKVADNGLAQLRGGLARQLFLQRISKSKSAHFGRSVAPSAGAGVGQHSLFRLLQRPFNIFHTMIGRMTVKVSRPIWSTLSTAKPFFRCLLQCGQNILLNLPVPS